MSARQGNLILNKEYKAWLAKLKQKVRNAQLKAAVKVNSEMLLFYWGLGADMVEKQTRTKWGDGFLSQLSKDLMSEFPDMKGFSRRNLYAIHRDDADYILETFPIVKRKDIAQFGEYRTKNLILEIYDAMQQAKESGRPYQTILDPPPADPQVAHSFR